MIQVLLIFTRAIFKENRKILLAELDGMGILLSEEWKEQQFWKFHFLTDTEKTRERATSGTRNSYTRFCGIT